MNGSAASCNEGSPARRHTIVDSPGARGGSGAPHPSMMLNQELMGSARTLNRGPNRRTRRTWPWLLVLSLLAGLAAWALRSDTFSIREVRVVGNHLASSDVIRRAAGITPGSNLWLASTRKVRARLASLAPIAEVRLVRKAPHLLTIVVRERTPWAAVVVGTRCLLVDPESKVIARVARPPANAPVVILGSAKEDEMPLVGSVIESGPLFAALRCLSFSRRTGDGVGISRVFIDARRDFWLNVNGSGKVMFGQPSNLGPKLAMLQSLYRKSPALLQNARYLDLQNPDAPAYISRPDPVKTQAANGSRRTPEGNKLASGVLKQQVNKAKAE